jgi:hypothetical protein
MFVLKAVIGKMYHQTFGCFNIRFGIVFNAESKVPRIIEDHTWVAVNKHIASDVEFFAIQEQGFDIMLHQAIVLQICVPSFCLI